MPDFCSCDDFEYIAVAGNISYHLFVFLHVEGGMLRKINWIMPVRCLEDARALWKLELFNLSLKKSEETSNK